jgi:integrase/recombinase XerD
VKLSDAVSQYVTHKQSLGMRFIAEADRLRALCRRVGEDATVADVSIDQVATFLAGKGPVTRTWFHKYSALNGFYSFAISRGYAQAIPLPRFLPRPPQAFVPYVFTKPELLRIPVKRIAFPLRCE